MLAAATAAGGVALLGLMTAGAASAGTLTQGSWSFTGPETSSSSYSAQVQQPINADGSSVFKLGTTVQVKFQLTGASAGIANAVAKLSYPRLPISIPPGPVNEAISTAAATSGNLFRYDAKTKQYVFNWGTKGLTAGLYQLKMDLGDGVSRTVNVTVK